MKRQNAPRLVQPGDVVRRATDRTLGIQSQLQTNRILDRLTRRNVGPPVKPTVSGSWSDGTAGVSLCKALAALGLIEDITRS
jgi:hypothetical protein